MPRQVSASIDAALSLPVTEPNYLIELVFGVTLRYATLRLTNWNGFTWLAAGARVESVSPESASISLRNHDNSLSALILNAQIHNVPCTIWQHYDDDAELVFAGRLNSVPPFAGARIGLSARAESRAAKYPATRIGAPLFNHITAAGTEIRWGNVTLSLEDAR